MSRDTRAWVSLKMSIGDDGVSRKKYHYSTLTGREDFEVRRTERTCQEELLVVRVISPPGSPSPAQSVNLLINRPSLQGQSAYFQSIPLPLPFNFGQRASFTNTMTLLGGGGRMMHFLKSQNSNSFSSTELFQSASLRVSRNDPLLGLLTRAHPLTRCIPPANTLFGQMPFSFTHSSNLRIIDLKSSQTIVTPKLDNHMKIFFRDQYFIATGGGVGVGCASKYLFLLVSLEHPFSPYLQFS